MALLECGMCGKKYSSDLERCPECGAALANARQVTAAWTAVANGYYPPNPGFNNTGFAGNFPSDNFDGFNNPGSGVFTPANQTDNFGGFNNTASGVFTPVNQVEFPSAFTWAGNNQAGSAIFTGSSNTIVDWQVGTVIAHLYELVEMLGRGAYGVVWKARDIVNSDAEKTLYVAMKLLPALLRNSQRELQVMTRNYQKVASLIHQHIAVYKSLLTDNDTKCLVMEYVDGLTLDKYCTKYRQEQHKNLPLDKIVHLAEQIALGLDFAHARNILHRDIKPENIMVDKFGDVKILDFGLAANIKDSMQRLNQEETGLEETYSTAVGTRQYMAPEQWQSQPIGIGVDQYALGILLYQMIAEKLPFDNSDPAVLMTLVLTSKPPAIDQLTPAQNQVLVKSLAKQPDQRYNNCREFVAEFKASLQSAVTARGVKLRTETAMPPPLNNKKTPPPISVTSKAISTDNDDQIEEMIILPERRKIDLGNQVNLDVVYIPAGVYAMGSPQNEKGRHPNETKHLVVISQPFYLGKTPITQLQYRTIMNDNPSSYLGDRRPVINVTWFTANSYCQKLSAVTGHKFRLPTEAEWEYACRAGTTTAFSTGNNLTAQQAYFFAETWQEYLGRLSPEERDKLGYNNGTRRRDATPHTSPANAIKQNVSNLKACHVGKYPPNLWGIQGMHGNVWEWCSDYYGDYPNSKVTDPKGADDGVYRVIRGGSFVDHAWICRSASRSIYLPNFTDSNIGFRVAMEI